MSALSCMAEFPGLVNKTFLNCEKSTRGKYKVQLWNGYMERWVIVTVDDFIPVRSTGGDIESAEADNFKFHFAKPKENELWVMILEKAFAKFRGSYKNLEGGNILWAFNALTGDHSFRLRKCHEPERKGYWEKGTLAHTQKPDEVGPVAVKPTNQSISERKMFDMLRAYDRSQALIGASMRVKNKSNAEEVDKKIGLVRGHAYSILAAKRVTSKNIELVQLRNPWGRLEWKGKWSDSSSLWTEHKDVAKAVGFKKDEDDGAFWMSYKDFLKFFDDIDICDRTVDYSDFNLDAHENPQDACKHCMGPTQGCVEGCVDYWFQCRGVKYIYKGNESDHLLKKDENKGGRDDTLLAGMKRL